MGKLAIAAKHTQAVAELYETQLMDLEVALGNYEKAADYYEMEDAQSSANKCHIKVSLRDMAAAVAMCPSNLFLALPATSL